MARLAFAALTERAGEVRWVDLAERSLPLCDGSGCYGLPEVQQLRRDLENVDGFIVATPIYNYGANAVLKNAIELTGRAVWSERIVGFACAAGGGTSYMSIMPLANSLMLDFRSVIIPRFVYARESDFDAGSTDAGGDAPDAADGVNPGIVERVHALAADVQRFSRALRGSAH